MKEIKFKKVEENKVFKTFKVRLTFTRDVLGTKPVNLKVTQDFLQSKMTKVDRMRRPELTEEDKLAKAVEEANKAEKALTVFYHDENGNALLDGYMLLGYLKEAARTLSNDKSMLTSEFFAGSLKTRIEEAFSVVEDRVPVKLPEGYDPYETVVEEVDGEKTETKRWKTLERSLRSDMRGVQIVSLTRSEFVPAGSTAEFTVEVRSETVPTTSGKKAVRVDAEKMLFQLLGEGGRRGLCQWRNGGFGRFEAEVAEV